MSTIHETDSAEHVFIHGIKAITRVLVDDEVGDFAKGPLKTFDHHCDMVLAKQKSQRASSLAAAYLNRAQIRTDRELALYGQRMVLSLGTHRKKGEKTPEYRYLFKAKTAATLLPSDDLQRREELDALVRRARNAQGAGPDAFAQLGALGEAIKAEKQALRDSQRANEDTEDAARVEENARVAVVVNIRAMKKDVQSFYADDPGLARRLLGHGNAVATRRRNERLAAQAAADKAAEQKALAEKAAAEAASEAAATKPVEPMESTKPATDAPRANAPLAIVPLPAEAAMVPDRTPRPAGDNGLAGPPLAEQPPVATRSPGQTPPN